VSSAAAAARAGPFASLRIPAFRWWFLAQILSGSGSMAQNVGTAWLVYELTGSGVDLGLMSVALFGPVLVAGAWAGALLDRVDCRRALIVTQVAAGTIALVLAVLTATHAVELWMVFALTVATGFVLALDQPARQMYVVELVGRDRVQSAVGLFEVIINASRILGPAVGGLMIATLGVAACFFANALTFLPPLLVLLRFRPPERREPQPRGRALAAVREGIAYVRRSPAIVACLGVAGAAGMLFNVGVALPVLAARDFGLGGAGYGALIAVFGIGAIPGGLAAARSGGKPRGRLIRLLSLLTGASVVATACAPSTAAAVPLLTLDGFLSIWLIALANALVQLQPPERLRGRVLGLWTMVLPGLSPVTGLVIGAVTQLAGPRPGFALAGVALGAAGLSGWRPLGAHDAREPETA
jgi:MFS family permease